MLKADADYITTWVPDASRSNCKCCVKRFHTFRRKHHCRQCGEVVCRKCSVARLYLRYQNDVVRICRDCCPNYGSNKGLSAVMPSASNPKCMEIQQVSDISTNIDTSSLPIKNSVMSYKNLAIFLGIACIQYALPIRALFVLSVIKAFLFIILRRNCDISRLPPIMKAIEEESQPENALVLYDNPSPVNNCNASRYIKSLEDAHDKALHAFSCKDGEDGWNFYGRQHDIDIFLKKEGDLTFVRGEGDIHVKKDLVTDLLNDSTRIGEYDPQIKHVEMVEELDSSLLTIEGEAPLISVIYSQCHRVFPTTARDACVVRARIMKDDGKIITIATSVEHPNAPDRRDYVRINLICSASVLEEISENQTRMKYLVMLDPTGNIPSFIADKIAPERALLIHRVKKCFDGKL